MDEKSESYSQDSLFEKIGGEPVVAKLVARFYQLMGSLDGVDELRDMHKGDLQLIVDKLNLFMTGWLGGPPLYVQKFGHPKLRARHLPFSIGKKERDQWLLCMFKAMEDCQIVNTPEAEHMKNALSRLADHMRNRADDLT